MQIDSDTHQHTNLLLHSIQDDRAATATEHAWCSCTHLHEVFPDWLTTTNNHTVIITSKLMVTCTSKNMSKLHDIFYVLTCDHGLVLL